MATSEEFVSESIEPLGGADTLRMARGEPGLPAEFGWRGDRFRVAGVAETWKESGRCTHSTERYLRKHWYRLAMADGSTWTVYFDRQARSARDRKRRWWLYTRGAGKSLRGVESSSANP